MHPNVVLNMGSENKSSLQFDDLALNYPNYYFRLIHCQADWNPSPLADLEYLQDFNDFPHSPIFVKISPEIEEL